MELEKVIDNINNISLKLDENLGDKLVAFYLFGSIMISEDFHPGISDINTFIVLKDNANSEDILKIKDLYRGSKKIPLAIPLILKESEIIKSADVFPIEFLEIIEKNRLIRGKDVLLELKISKKDVRVQCESEIRSKIIGLRKMLFGIDEISKNLDIIYKSLTSTIILLKQLLRLKDIEIPSTRMGIIEAIEKNFGRKLTGIKNLYLCREKKEKLNRPTIQRLLTNYLEELEFFSEIIDNERID